MWRIITKNKDGQCYCKIAWKFGNTATLMSPKNYFAVFCIEFFPKLNFKILSQMLCKWNAFYIYIALCTFSVYMTKWFWINLTHRIYRLSIKASFHFFIEQFQSCDDRYLSQVKVTDSVKRSPVTGRHLLTGQIFPPFTGLTCHRTHLSQVATCWQVKFFHLLQVWPVTELTCRRPPPVDRSNFFTCHRSELSQVRPATGRNLLTGRKNLPVTDFTCHLSQVTFTIKIFFLLWSIKISYKILQFFFLPKVTGSNLTAGHFLFCIFKILSHTFLIIYYILCFNFPFPYFPFSFSKLLAVFYIFNMHFSYKFNYFCHILYTF